MAIDAQNVGANSRAINIIGDPSAAGNMGAVLPIAAGTSLAGKFGIIVGSTGLVLNSGGTYDPVLATPGIVGVPAISIEGIKNTYSAGITGLNLAATATDFFEIYGSGTKTIRILLIEISGYATAAATNTVQLLKRTTANTSGTSSVPTTTLHDTSNTAATAALKAYTANPTLGTLGGLVRSAKLNLGAVGAAGKISWEFGTRNDQAIVLRGTTQGLVLNWNGAAVPSGDTLDIFISWVEDAS